MDFHQLALESILREATDIPIENEPFGKGPTKEDTDWNTLVFAMRYGELDLWSYLPCWEVERSRREALLCCAAALPAHASSGGALQRRAQEAGAGRRCRRRRPHLVHCALTADQLPDLVLVLVSHAHCDHLGTSSLGAIRGKPAVVMAVETADLLPSGWYSSVNELRWNDSAKVVTPRGEALVRSIEVKHWLPASGGTPTAATPASSSSRGTQAAGWR